MAKTSFVQFVEKSCLVELFVVWLLLTIIVGGVSWELGLWVDSGRRGFDLTGKIKTIALVGSAVVIFLLAVIQFRYSIAFSGIILGGFAIYHIVNFGRPRGCLSLSSTSGMDLIFGNGALSIVCIAYSFFERKSRHWKHLVLIGSACTALSGAIVFFAMRQDSPSAWLMTPCKWLGQTQPFLLGTGFERFSLETGTHDVVVLRRDWSKCLDFASRTFSVDVIEQLSITTSTSQLIVRKTSGNDWRVFDFMEGQAVASIELVPSKMIIVEGIVQSCTALDRSPIPNTIE